MNPSDQSLPKSTEKVDSSNTSPQKKYFLYNPSYYLKELFTSHSIKNSLSSASSVEEKAVNTRTIYLILDLPLKA